jgi:formylglycine-generating enzyme required for sulfatase activity
MAGNIFEWCFDEWPSENEPWRVVRGGSHRSVALLLRTTFRGRYPADTRKDFLGFRVVRLREAELR